MQSRNVAIIAIIAIASLLAACKKKDGQTPDLNTTRHSLYNTYKDGEIDECTYNGATVYCAGINAFDAGSTVYDAGGKPIGNCNYAWGSVDPICSKLQNCRVVYRCKNHISGQPFVDVYELSK